MRPKEKPKAVAASFSLRRSSSREPKRRGRTTERKLKLAATAEIVPTLLDWFLANARDLPWRRTLDPYAIWVSEIMLQQTQVKTVIPYYERWLGDLPNIAALAAARPEHVLKLWEGLGYYTRARNLQKAAQQIAAEHAGQFPREFEAVLALPGIGRYTAGAVCSIAFNQPTPILDGNVIRVLTRLFGIKTSPHEKQTTARLWRLAEELVHAAAGLPHSSFRAPHSAFLLSGPCSVLNQSLMELGATVCLPRQPRCTTCLLAKDCVARRNGLADQIPNLGQRPPLTRRRFVALVAQRHGRLLVRQRRPDELNGSLWEFPSMEVLTAGGTAADLASQLFGNRIAPAPLCRINHSITRYRIEVEAFTVALDHADKERMPPGQWISFAKVNGLAFTSAHRKILTHFQQHLAPR